MKSPIVYLDTSFIIGLLDNVDNRRRDAQEVLRYERSQQSRIYTSILTINEYTVKYFDKFSGKDHRDRLIAEAKKAIRNIAEIYGINDDVALESARLMSVWGKIRKLADPPLPRDRKHRWDTLHLATACILKADRVYAFDKPWNEYPADEIPSIGQVIYPARVQQPSFNYEMDALSPSLLGQSSPTSSSSGPDRKILFATDEEEPTSGDE